MGLLLLCYQNSPIHLFTRYDSFEYRSEMVYYSNYWEQSMEYCEKARLSQSIHAPHYIAKVLRYTVKEMEVENGRLNDAYA